MYSSERRNALGAAIAIVTMALVMAIVAIAFSISDRSKADDAINLAIDRMEAVVDQDNLATLAIACGNTHDSIACVGDKDGKITITYYSGDNAHRKPYATVMVWVKKQPQLLFTETKFN